MRYRKKNELRKDKNDRERENTLVDLQAYTISFPSLILSLSNRSFSFTRVLCADFNRSLSTLYEILNTPKRQK